MHGAGFSPGPVLRNVIPFLGGWFLLAPMTRVYRQVNWRTLLTQWAVVIPLAVVVRQLWVGRLVSRATVAFLVASLILTLAILIVGRVILWIGRRTAAR